MKAIPSLFSILVLMLLLSSASCGGATSQVQSADSISEPSRTAAPFDADTALRYIREQVAFGVRTPGSEGHKACASWIESKLRDWGYTVTLQHFTGKDYFGTGDEHHRYPPARARRAHPPDGPLGHPSGSGSRSRS